MEEHNSPRKTRSGKLLGNATRRGEDGRRGDAGMEMPPVDHILMVNEELMDEVPAVQDTARGETAVDVIDLTQDYIVEDVAGDRTITIVDDEDTPTGKYLLTDLKVLKVIVENVEEIRKKRLERMGENH